MKGGRSLSAQRQLDSARSRIDWFHMGSAQERRGLRRNHEPDHRARGVRFLRGRQHADIPLAGLVQKAGQWPDIIASRHIDHDVGLLNADLEVAARQIVQTGMILGTAAYMSPEQAKGRTVDKRSDVWAFGAGALRDVVGATGLRRWRRVSRAGGRVRDGRVAGDGIGWVIESHRRPPLTIRTRVPGGLPTGRRATRGTSAACGDRLWRWRREGRPRSRRRPSCF